MQCLKCGREIEPEQVFCADCLADMEKYPVKPGTVVHIPRRPPQNMAKKTTAHRHPTASLEEQIKKLKKRIVALSLVLILALVTVAGLCWLEIEHYMGQNNKFLPGQNYSSAASTGPDASD